MPRAWPRAGAAGAFAFGGRADAGPAAAGATPVTWLALLLALRGTVFLYQGEELGLPEVLDVSADRREDPLFARTNGAEIGRDGCRIPLPWSADEATAYGFSAVTPTDGPWLPQPDGWGAYAADRQASDEASTLAHYRHVLGHRRALDVHAPLEWVLPDSDELVAYRRGAVLVVLNVSDRDIALPAELVGDGRLIISSVRTHTDPAVVPANACTWLLHR